MEEVAIAKIYYMDSKWRQAALKLTPSDTLEKIRLNCTNHPSIYAFFKLKWLYDLTYTQYRNVNEYKNKIFLTCWTIFKITIM